MAGITGMPIGKIASDIVQVWGFPDFSSAVDFAQERARVEINTAIQQMQDAGEDFYGREDVLIPLVADQDSYVLDSTVQTVLGPVTFEDDTPLFKLTTRGQTLQYGEIFGDQLSSILTSGRPAAYFIDTQFSAAEDSVKTIVELFPAPSAAFVAGLFHKLVLPVIKEAAQFSIGQLTAGTATLPVPHKYVESIFLPLARYNATTFFLFYQKDRFDKYESDYLRALQLLGQADPRQPKLRDESNTDALELRARQPRQQTPGP